LTFFCGGGVSSPAIAIMAVEQTVNTYNQQAIQVLMGLKQQSTIPFFIDTMPELLSFDDLMVNSMEQDQ